MEKIDRSYLRYTRYMVQWGIFFFLIYAGYMFFVFVEHFTLSNTQSLTPETILSLRSPSVEGFLPIGALMALKLWITTGMFDYIHPAGLVIFIAAILTALLLKKSFCGWICPVGALSDAVWKLGRKIFGRNFILPKYADYSLRSVKYVLMAFFLYVIVIKMPGLAIYRFLEGDYYKIADVKMLYFFTKMTTATFIALLLLFILSLSFKNFWCRYLCPYGALLGIISFCSPLKITRNVDACIDCGKCARECPSILPVDRKIRVRTPECTGCMTCVSHCPAKGALDMAFAGKRVLNPILFVILVAFLFFGVIGIGKLTGRWYSAISYGEYESVIPRASILEHP